MEKLHSCGVRNDAFTKATECLATETKIYQWDCSLLKVSKYQTKQPKQGGDNIYSGENICKPFG